jgi:putative oxidoreductase
VITSPAETSGRTQSVGIWILRVVLGLAFLFFSSMKLSGNPRMVEEFRVVGLGQWFRYATGTLELIGGLAILTPRVSALGAILLLLVTCGAFVAQVAILHIDWIHCVVIAALLILTIYLQRAQLQRLLR